MLGVAVAAGDVPYLAGAGRALADTTQRTVASGGGHVINWAADRGAPKRVVEGLTALIAILLPGVTALLLIVAARGTLTVRRIVAALLVLAGVMGYFYHPKGIATGTLVLVVAVASVGVALSGPLIATPLAGLATLIGAEYLPRLARLRPTAPDQTVATLHHALFGSTGAPLALRTVATIVAAVPFAAAILLAVRD